MSTESTEPVGAIEDGETGMYSFWDLTPDEQAELAPFDPHPTSPTDDIPLVHPDGTVEFLVP